MGFRPEWYEGDGGGSFGSFQGGPRSWSATKVIIIGCLGVFALQVMFFAFMRRDPLPEFLGLKGSNTFFLFPFVTYMFLHSVTSPFHIIFNLLGVYFFGRELEGNLGIRRFLGLYLGAGIVGGGLQALILALMGDTSTPIIGASGGVYGIIIYYAILYPNRRVIFFIFPMKMWHLAALFIALNLYMTALSPSGSVATLAHLAGGGWGYLFWRFNLDPAGWFVTAREKVDEVQEKRRVEQDGNDSKEMDRILKKIHDEGLPSLTTSERRFIDRMSKELKNRR